MKRSWIVGGWLIALLASALPPAYFIADRVQRNHLGEFVDPETGAWTSAVYSQFLTWWSPIAIPVTLLALACMVLNRPDGPRRD